MRKDTAHVSLFLAAMALSCAAFLFFAVDIPPATAQYSLSAAPFGFIPLFAYPAKAGYATTSVFVSICGNSVQEPTEVCDQGSNNSNQYKPSISTRTCNAECTGWSPHCGDKVLNAAFGEECDDGNNTAGDGCTSACIIESTTGGGGGHPGAFVGGSPAPLNPTKVVVNGKAYPNQDVHILKDGEVIGVVKAETTADFMFSTTVISPGVTTLGFWSQDDKGIKSIAFTVTLQITANAVTTISGVFLPPTITLEKRSVKKGETLNITGQTAPEVSVAVHVHSAEEVIETVQSAENGKWKLALNTGSLAEDDFHTAKAQFQVGKGANIIKSGFSNAVSFYVGEGEVSDQRLRADLNGDGFVNLVDFSILLFHWGTADKIADINDSGKVDLTDVSIMLFYWTG